MLRVDAAVALALGVMVLVALLTRLPSFTDAMFGDEVSTYLVVHGHGIGRLIDLVQSDQEATPPAYFLLASAASQLGSASDWLRLPSLLAGLATIPLTYELGKRTVGRPAAVVGAALVTLSPFLIYYSSEARSYSVSVLVCLLSTLSLIRASDEEQGRSGRWWVAYALFSATAMYTHYTNFFVLLAQAAWAFVAIPRSRRRLLLANLGAVAAFLPWLPDYLADARSPAVDVIGSLDPLSFHSLFDSLSRLEFGAPYLRVGELPGEPALIAIAVGIAIGLVGAARPTERPTDWWRSRRFLLVVVLAFAVPLGNVIYSLVSVDILTPRNLITSWPGWALLLGAVVTRPSGRWRLAAAAFVLGGFVAGTAMMLNPDNQRPDYTQAAAYLLSHATSAEPIVDAPANSPGTKQALEIAMADRGAGDRTILRVGIPTLADAEALRAPGGAGQFADVPIPSGSSIARQALADADGGPISYVTGGGGDFELRKELLRGTAPGDFLDALPTSYHLLSTAHFPGLNGGVSVYQLGPDSPRVSASPKAP